MGRPRTDLSELLRSTLGSSEVYFQTPDGKQMKYPAIVYSRSPSSVQHASNLPYRHAKGWTITVIDRDPNNPVADKVEMLPYTTLDRTYRADGLNHSVLTMFF